MCSTTGDLTDHDIERERFRQVEPPFRQVLRSAVAQLPFLIIAPAEKLSVVIALSVEFALCVVPLLLWRNNFVPALGVWLARRRVVSYLPQRTVGVHLSLQFKISNKSENHSQTMLIQDLTHRAQRILVAALGELLRWLALLILVVAGY